MIGENLKIVSAFTLNWIKGAIFIEAEDDLEIHSLISDLDCFEKKIEVVEKD